MPRDGRAHVGSCRIPTARSRDCALRLLAVHLSAQRRNALGTRAGGTPAIPGGGLRFAPHAVPIWARVDDASEYLNTDHRHRAFRRCVCRGWRIVRFVASAVRDQRFPILDGVEECLELCVELNAI